MIKLYSPENDGELAIIKSIFDGENISYFVHNDHFGTLNIGPKIDLYNAKTILVSEEDVGVATELIQEFVENTTQSPPMDEEKIALKDKLRMILEALIFTWFIPGKRWRKKRILK